MVRTRLILAAALLVAACSREQTETERQAELQAAHVKEVVAAGGVVDSVLAPAEMLRRFRLDLPATDSLRHASASVEALIARLATSVGTRDTAELRALVMDRAEFAWLFYEESPLSKPPYEAPPGLLWGQMDASSNTGVKELVDRFGGSRVRVGNLTCPPAEHEGRNRLHKRCTVEFSAPGKKTLSGNLFGTVIERDGRFKLVSFANRI
jgi:hypothetical protein